MGLSFSVPEGAITSFSPEHLQKEVETGYGADSTHFGRPYGMGKQGVFLLNTILTVEAYAPRSHQPIGCKSLLTEVISKLSELRRDLVFILWGNDAQKKEGEHDR